MAQASFAAMRFVRGLDLHSFSDQLLSRTARECAERSGCPLFCYSYYAVHAFEQPNRLQHRLLFQLHPHPESVRTLLREELERVPAARYSLLQEPDLNRAGKSFDALANESQLATAIAVASSFTKATLIAHGVRPNIVSVLPYGVDPLRFPVRSRPAPEDGPLTVIWLGQLSQRKGLSYFLDAIRTLSSKSIRVLLRGRGTVDRRLLDTYRDLPLDIVVDLPRADIVKDLRNSHVYVLPSLVEGFGQTILEAMSCGLPVITTPNTCGPDVIEHGKDGFILPIRDSAAIATALQWCLDNRGALTNMGFAASAKARRMDWSTFRHSIRSFYREQVDPVAVATRSSLQA